MAVTNTLFTTNSYRIDIVNELGNGSTNIIAGVNTALTLLGWSLYDSINAAGFNPVVTRVYRVLNVDGVTFKYLIIRWDTVKLFFYTSTCETWNTIGKLPINESWTNAGAFAQGYDLVLSSIIVSATNRHAMLWNFINNHPGLWTAVLEFERVAAEDTVTAPGGSLLFNGTSDFCSVPASDNMNLAGRDFTIEAWILPTGFVSPSGGAPVIIAQSNGSTTGTYELSITAGGDITWSSWATSPRANQVTFTTNNTRLILNQWNHVAVSYDSQNIRIFINGVLAGISVALPPFSVMYSSSSIITGIAHFNSNAVATGYFPGYITNLRIIKGQCLYNATFSLALPPSYYVPLTAVTGTQLLVTVTSAGNRFLDSSPNNFNLTLVFGGTAGAFNDATPMSGGMPCYAWTNSLQMGTPSGIVNVAEPGSPIQYSSPRTIAGGTGVSGTIDYTSVTNRGPMPPVLSTASPGAPTQGITTINARDGNFGHLASYANIQIPYGWDTAKSPVSTISVMQGTPITQSPAVTPLGARSVAGFGRIYNVSIGRGLGNIRAQDTSFANLDSTNGWVSSTGANTAALLLPLNGGHETNNGTTTINASIWNPSTFSNTFANVGPSVFPGKAVVVGDTIFVSANSVAAAANTGSGIFTISQAAGNFSTPTFRANIPFGVFDMVFDGNGSIWGTTANGVMRMNPTTFSTVFYPDGRLIANGAGYMGIDGTNIYVSTRISNTKPQVLVFNYKTQTWSSPPIETTTAFTVASTWGTPVPDYTGNVFLFQTAGTTLITSLYMQKNNAAGTVFATVNSTLNPGAGANNYGHSGHYDFISGRLFEVTGNPGISGFTTVELFTANLTQAGITVNILTNNNTVAFYQGGLAPRSISDFKGDLSIFPFRGHYFIHTKRPGQVQYTGGTTSALGRFISPLWVGGTALNAYSTGIPIGTGNSPTGTLSSVPVSGSGWNTTNGVQMFGTWGPVNTVDTRVYVVNGIYTANTTSGANVGRIIMKG
jgi:hypothetical protein